MQYIPPSQAIAFWVRDIVVMDLTPLWPSGTTGAHTPAVRSLATTQKFRSSCSSKESCSTNTHVSTGGLEEPMQQSVKL